MKIVRREIGDDSGLLEIKDAVIRSLLASRGISTLEDASTELRYLLHYRDLPDIDLAAKRIADAVINNEKVLVFGDYDVDGMTGAALGVRALRALGLEPEKVSCKVPSRYDGGYGLSPKEVELAKSSGVQLILTVDNGISCLDAAERASELDIDLVITDHHECQENLPKALAVVDPKRPDNKFGSTALCGAGVLFYVLSATRAVLDDQGYYASRPKPVMANFLDLVALGTVGDVVAFDPNNRRLVKAGLDRLHRGATVIGVSSLASYTKTDLSLLDPHAIGFELCPRLNAAGRIKLEDNPALDLLLTDDPKKADELSSRLEMCNRRRGDFERVSLKEAREDAAEITPAGGLVLYRSNWLSGITGLIAGRLKEDYGMPCFAFSGEGDVLKGSARSVPGVPLGEILRRMTDEHPGILIGGGGHAMAAGANIRASALDKFREVFQDYCLEYLASPKEAELITDGELDNDYLNLDFARTLEELGPWGEGFPEPLFDGVFEVVSIYIIKNMHVRFTLKSENGRVLNAIKFRASVQEKALISGIKVRTVYALEINRYQGAERLQVRLESVEPL